MSDFHYVTYSLDAGPCSDCCGEAPPCTDINFPDVPDVVHVVIFTSMHMIEFDATWDGTRIWVGGDTLGNNIQFCGNPPDEDPFGLFMGEFHLIPPTCDLLDSVHARYGSAALAADGANWDASISSQISGSPSSGIGWSRNLRVESLSPLQISGTSESTEPDFIGDCAVANGPFQILITGVP